jgi:hypothetical protein
MFMDLLLSWINRQFRNFVLHHLQAYVLEDFPSTVKKIKDGHSGHENKNLKIYAAFYCTKN